MTPLRTLTVVLLCLLPAVGQAAGAVWKVADDWPRLEQKIQAALIAHAEGRQRMVLAVRLEMLAADQGLWLVPVRGAPAEVRLALAPGLPWFIGGTAHPDRTAREDVANIAGLAALAAAPGSPLSLGLAGMAIPGLLRSSPPCSRPARQMSLPGCSPDSDALCQPPGWQVLRPTWGRLTKRKIKHAKTQHIVHQ